MEEHREAVDQMERHKTGLVGRKKEEEKKRKIVSCMQIIFKQNTSNQTSFNAPLFRQLLHQIEMTLKLK